MLSGAFESDCRSSPILRAILNAEGETSMRVPTGRFTKRGDEAPSSVETGDGDGDRTGWKCAADSRTPPLRLMEAVRSVFNVVGEEGSGPESMRTSLQPSPHF